MIVAKDSGTAVQARHRNPSRFGFGLLRHDRRCALFDALVRRVHRNATGGRTMLDLETYLRSSLHVKAEVQHS